MWIDLGVPTPEIIREYIVECEVRRKEIIREQEEEEAAALNLF